MPPQRLSPEHGSRTSYTAGCRCAPCTEANRVYIERWRRRRGVEQLQRGTFAPHGTRSRYTRGCRCDECTEANTTYERARRRQQRGA